MLTLTNVKKKRFFVLFAALLVLLSIGTRGTSFAATADGSSPDQALTPGSQQTVNGGESVWYAFHYGLDVDRKAVEVSVWLEGNPDRGTNFEVWTTERLQQWQQQDPGDDEVQPVGAGSANEYTSGDYFWAGNLYQAGTYYVHVKNDTLTPNTHTLYVAGKTVTLPKAMMDDDAAEEESKGSEAEVTASEEPEMTEAPAEEAEATSEATAAKGMSPEDALRINGEWKELKAGASVWYAFDYAYDSDNPVNASVWMNSLSDNGINFSVWTVEQVQREQQRHIDDDEVKPIGRGSQNDHTPGDYFWAGKFYQSGTYYVRVQNNNSTSSYYQLNMNSGN